MITVTESTITDAEFYDLYKSFIPKGIYYELSKKRWRVRLYKTGRVIYLGYFKQYDDARQALRKAKRHQRLSTRGKTEDLNLNTDDTPNLINTLSQL